MNDPSTVTTAATSILFATSLGRRTRRRARCAAPPCVRAPARRVPRGARGLLPIARARRCTPSRNGLRASLRDCACGQRGRKAPSVPHETDQAGTNCNRQHRVHRASFFILIRLSRQIRWPYRSSRRLPNHRKRKGIAVDLAAEMSANQSCEPLRVNSRTCVNVRKCQLTVQARSTSQSGTRAAGHVMGTRAQAHRNKREPWFPVPAKVPVPLIRFYLLVGRSAVPSATLR